MVCLKSEVDPLGCKLKKDQMWNFEVEVLILPANSEISKATSCSFTKIFFSSPWFTSHDMWQQLSLIGQFTTADYKWTLLYSSLLHMPCQLLSVSWLWITSHLPSKIDKPKCTGPKRSWKLYIITSATSKIHLRENNIYPRSQVLTTNSQRTWRSSMNIYHPLVHPFQYSVVHLHTLIHKTVIQDSHSRQTVFKLN